MSSQDKGTFGLEPSQPPLLQPSPPRFAPPATPVHQPGGAYSIQVRCANCDGDLCSAAVGGTCPECGELVARSFAIPERNARPLPVACVQCGHDLSRDAIDGLCSQCGHPVMKTLRQRAVKPDGPVYAPLAVLLGVLTLPCALASSLMGVAIGVLAMVFFIPSHWEFQDKIATPALFVAASAAALIGMGWILAFLAYVAPPL